MRGDQGRAARGGLALLRRDARLRQSEGLASYSVNERAIARARGLIKSRQYVVRSEWGQVQPRAANEDAFLASHSWEEYAEWHLGLTAGAGDETKARYAFVYGTSADSTARGSSPATTAQRSGSTRRSSWPLTSCCRYSIGPAHEGRGRGS